MRDRPQTPPRPAPPPRPFELDPARVEVRPGPPPPLPPAVLAADAAEAVDEPAAEILRPRRRRGWRGWLAGLFGIGLLGSVVLGTVDQVVDLVAQNPLLGWPLAAFLSLLAVAAIGWTGLEMRELRRLSGRASLRRDAERLASSDLHGEAAPLLAEVTAELGGRRELAGALTRFDADAAEHLSDGERLRLYERRVLAPVDRAAYRLVLAGGRDIGLLTALSPLGLLDGVLVLWRTTVMLRAIARLYGMAPGPAATLSLLRRCLRNALLAGLADVVSHAALEHVGAGLMALLSARAGQGAGNALLSARLGLEAIRQCRPLPFVAEEPPRLSRIRTSLLEGMTATPTAMAAERQPEPDRVARR